MRNLSKFALLSFGIIAIGLSTITLADHAFAANHCKKNHDNNCNHPNKNQNSSPKINCEIHIDAEDHLNNNDFGPTNQQCQNNSNNIKDSTVTQTSPGDNNGDGSGGSPQITISPSSGPVGTSVTVTGTEFTPLSVVTITFDNGFVATATTTSAGSFIANFDVPVFIGDHTVVSIGDHTVKASQGSNSASKTFKVTALVNPFISLQPQSGPVDASVNITGAGFAPSTTVDISFNGSTVTTSTPGLNGVFFANFTVPPSSIGPVPVIATQSGSSPASKTFTVTLGSTSFVTSRSSLGLPGATTPSSPNLSEKMILPDIFA